MEPMMDNSTSYEDLTRRAMLAERAAEQVDREGKCQLSRTFREHAQMWKTMAERYETNSNH